MKLHLDTFKLQHLLFLTCIRIILKPAKVEIVHSLLRIPLLRILRDQKLYGSLCNFVHRSLHQKSIMGTPLFTGNAFQWAWFCNELKRKYNVTKVLKLVPENTKQILCACSENQVRPELSIPAAGQKDPGLWERECFSSRGSNICPTDCASSLTRVGKLEMTTWSHSNVYLKWRKQRSWTNETKSLTMEKHVENLWVGNQSETRSDISFLFT